MRNESFLYTWTFPPKTLKVTYIVTYIFNLKINICWSYDQSRDLVTKITIIK